MLVACVVVFLCVGVGVFCLCAWCFLVWIMLCFVGVALGIMEKFSAGMLEVVRREPAFL